MGATCFVQPLDLVKTRMQVSIYIISSVANILFSLSKIRTLVSDILSYLELDKLIDIFFYWFVQMAIVPCQFYHIMWFLTYFLLFL